MQYSIVNYSEIKSNPDFRYESEFFLPKYVEEENILSELNTIKLSSCAKLTNGNAFDSSEFSNNGDVFISKIGDVTQKRSYLLWEKVSKSHFEKLNGQYLGKNDILMTLTGDPPDVGKVQIIFDPPEKQLSWNQRVARLKLKKQDQINSQEYLFSALSSKYCRDHIERWAKGIRQRNVGNSAVLNMKIPVFSNIFQDQIKKTIVTSFTSLESSKSFYAEAENLLLSELEFETWKPQHKLSYIKYFSDTLDAERIDAEYFQPKYDEIMEKLSKFKVKTIKKLFNIYSSKSFKYSGDKDDIAVIKTKNLTKDKINLDNIENYISEKEFQTFKSGQKVQYRDVLFASMGVGSLGKANIFLYDKGKNCTVDSTLKIIREKKEKRVFAEVLSVLLNTLFMQEFLYKNVVGSTGIINIYDSKILNLPVPILSKNKQKKIAEKVINSHKAREESKNLLEKAKKAIEIAVEESESEAIKYLN